jgi:hypothetical protein
METLDSLPFDRLRESLERSEAQIAAGETVPIERVLDRLRASIARMKATRREASRIIASEA